MTRDDILYMSKRKAADAERQKLADWMRANHFVVNNDRTMEELLKDLEWQVRPV